MNKKTFQLKENYSLESGIILKNPQVAYHTYGTLNKDKSNVVWVTHALTADSDVYSWWKGYIGENDYINDQDYFIICANILGSHYGTTSPLSIDPETSLPYYDNFPEFTIRDIVKLHIELANHLGINEIYLLLGGSMGGHQAMEWAIIEPERIKNLILIATSAIHSPWGTAFNESQRAAIENDPTWNDKSENAGIEGLKVARSVAMLSYRNFKTYNKTQHSSDDHSLFPDKAPSYQRYQGEKLARRFNAYSYWYLSKAMDSHNVGRKRGGLTKALHQIKAKTLVISLEDDILFPLNDQLQLTQNIPHSSHSFIPSFYGHDGFLIETESLSKITERFLNSDQLNSKTFKMKTKSHHDYLSAAYIKIGLIGMGTVGTAFYQQIESRDDIQISKVALKSKNKNRIIPNELITYDSKKVINDPDIQVIVELIDDSKSALEMARDTLLRGKTYITANKKMLANHIEELKQLELNFGGKLLYEASVGGAIPVMRVLKEVYKSEPIHRIEGIINGSTNYILTQMDKNDLPFSEALIKAQEEGFAESDPTLDIDGYDAAYKAVILAYNAMGVYVKPETVERVGISNISKDDIRITRKKNERIKLVATIERTKDNVSVNVKPRKLSNEDDLYHIENELNAISIEGQYSGSSTLKGLGAGGHPTASAVVADLNYALKELKHYQSSIRSIAL